MVTVTGAMPPAPRPWIARKMISMVMLVARPQSTEPTRNVAMPNRITRLRPNRSESLP